MSGRPLPFVILMGLTGAGKSTFVNNCSPCGGRGAEVGAGLKPVTRATVHYEVSLSMSNNRLLLVDTPGFDDSEGLSDQDIVDQIIRWIQDYCGRGNATVKCGVILLQEEKQRDCYQGGPNLVRHLETALHRYRAAVLTIMTNDKVRNGGQDVYKYSGRTYGVSEVTTFCHEQLGRILGAGLPAKDLLAELAEARKVVRGSTGKRSIIARFMNRLKKAFS